MFNPRREFIFGDARPFAQCHASTLIESRRGRAFVAWFGGSREGESDVGIWASSRAAERHGASIRAPGDNWTAPQRIAKVSDAPHWNPVLYALTDSGTEPGPESGHELVLQFKVGTSIRSWVTWITRSSDGGDTWHSPQPLDLADLDTPSAQSSRGGRGAVRNKPIQLVSGDWLAGASVETWKRWDAFFDRSPNGLDQWRATELIALDRTSFSGKGLIQPALWESPPGHVHALFRSTNGRIYRSDSEDDGRTFCPAYPVAVPNNNSGLDLARLGNGCLALVCNPVAGNWAARTPLSILFSWDNGESWPSRIELETEPGEFSYPAVIAAGPEHEDLVVTYTWNRRRIAYLRIPAEELPRSPTREVDRPAPHS